MRDSNTITTDCGCNWYLRQFDVPDLTKPPMYIHHYLDDSKCNVQYCPDNKTVYITEKTIGFRDGGDEFVARFHAETWEIAEIIAHASRYIGSY